MANALLMLHVHIEVSDEDDAPFGSNALPATGELTALHRSLVEVTPVTACGPVIDG
jgi:hypothetical protein